MANGKINISEINITADPLDENLLPKKTKSPTQKRINISDINITFPKQVGDQPGTSDLLRFPEEEARQREIFRDYGVSIRPGINLQETAAKLQSTGSKWANGTVKMLGTAATTFVEPFSDIVVGLPTALFVTGKASSFYDNPVTNALDDLNEYLRKEFPNYYTQAETDYGFFKSLGTANFWADQALQGVGFLSGAILSGSAAAGSGLVTAGVKGLGRQAIKTNAIASWRNVTNAFRSQKKAQTAADIGRLRRTIGRVDYTAAAANQFSAGLFSAAGEAGIEARETTKRSKEVLRELRANKDPRYINMSDERIDELATSAGNVAFGLNSLIVGGSNIYQFGKLFSSGWKNNSTKYIKGIIQKEPTKQAAKGIPKYTARELSKNWKKGYKVVNWFKRPAAEAFEEWSQASINIGAEDYFKRIYSAVPWKGMEDYLEGGFGIMESLVRGYIESPQTKEGQQAIFLGALLGKLGEAGGSVLAGGKTSVQEWQDNYDATVGLVDILNQDIQGVPGLLSKNSKLYNLLKAHNEFNKLQGNLDKALENGDVFDYKNNEAARLFTIVDNFINADKLEDLKSFIEDLKGYTTEDFNGILGIDKDSESKPSDAQIQEVLDKIEFIENQKPEIDSFLATRNVPPIIQALLSSGIRYYSYMENTLSKREKDMSAELLKITDNKINWNSIRETEIGSPERLAEFQRQIDEAEKFKLYPFIKEQANELLIDLFSTELVTEQYKKLINETIDISEDKYKELQKIEKEVEKNLKKSKTDSENTVKSQVNEEQDDDQSDANIDQVYQDKLRTESDAISDPDEDSETLADEILQQAAQEQAKKDIEKEEGDVILEEEEVVVEEQTGFATQQQVDDEGLDLSFDENPDAGEDDIGTDNNDSIDDSGDYAETASTAAKTTLKAVDPNLTKAFNGQIVDGETPDNSNVNQDNENINEGQSEIDGIIPLMDILSIAWKSSNHPDMKGVRRISVQQKALSDFLESKDNEEGWLKGATITFKIDITDDQMEKVEAMQPIIKKIKNKKKLTKKDLEKVVIVAELKYEGNTYKAYLHEMDYVDDHIILEKQKDARERLLNTRRLIYKNFLENKTTSTTVYDMTTGHLNKTRDRNKLSPISDNLELAIASGGSYINENGETSINKSANPKSNGAVYLAVKANNGEKVPIRVLVSNLTPAAAEFLFDVYNNLITTGAKNTKAKISSEFFNTLKGNLTQRAKTGSTVFNEGLVELMDALSKQKADLLYSDILELIVFQGNKTKTLKSPTLVAGNGILTIGNSTFKKGTINREGVIKALLNSEKRFNVNRKYINTNLDFKYNRFLDNAGILFTNAAPGNLTTGSPFIQPTVRFDSPKQGEIKTKTIENTVKKTKKKKTTIAVKGSATPQDFTNLLGNQALNIDVNKVTPEVTDTQKTKKNQNKDCK